MKNPYWEHCIKPGGCVGKVRNQKEERGRFKQNIELVSVTVYCPVNKCRVSVSISESTDETPASESRNTKFYTSV